MISRASGPLLVAYLMLFVAGGFFLIAPSIVLAEATDYNDLTVVWGLFYLCGGAVAAASLIARQFYRIFKNRISLWYFETSGLSLVITANIVYAYTLVRAGLFYDESNLIALGLVLISFSSGLVARVIETRRLIKILVKMSKVPGEGL